MSLIKSISGIRGTIGGTVGDALTPVDIVGFAAAYARQLQMKYPDKKRLKVVVGRDARISGEMVDNVVCGTLLACGVDVVNAGLASTPTTEMAVLFEHADGGIILTASHNPKQWNALKLLNEKGEFLTDAEGKALQRVAETGDFDFVDVDRIGKLTRKDFTQAHIDAVLNYPLVDVPAIKAAGFKVVLDAINSVGGICMPALFKALGVTCVTLNGEPNGHFAHNPEPLPANLVGLSEAVVREKADLGVSVDPDVDRLAFICENGVPFGEEYTLVAVADSVLSVRPGPTVSNISSSRALRDVTEAHGCRYQSSKVGEVNVSTLMQEIGAVIGGEGNGGVIVPDLHYGRDALIGTALFLSILAHKKVSASALRATYPDYFVSKNKIEMSDPAQIEAALDAVEKHFAGAAVNKLDGLRIDFEQERKWFILRKSNTEPIIRIYAEAPTEAAAEAVAQEVIAVIGQTL
ncbi:MAG: phosphoglucosamine mutase [Bacteroidales bacterium]|nr:phosphoglucosamine mutase [Bacteroidales bacterium]MBQ1754571.1 phosphoglucosamine mutase [Bacteroidales bacterium]MBQ5434731.1 phosphoglucosamine mutase [Bacteroidales bacterium]